MIETIPTRKNLLVSVLNQKKVGQLFMTHSSLMGRVDMGFVLAVGPDVEIFEPQMIVRFQPAKYNADVVDSDEHHTILSLPSSLVYFAERANSVYKVAKGRMVIRKCQGLWCDGSSIVLPEKSDVFSSAWDFALVIASGIDLIEARDIVILEGNLNQYYPFRLGQLDVFVVDKSVLLAKWEF